MSEPRDDEDQQGPDCGSEWIVGAEPVVPAEIAHVLPAPACAVIATEDVREDDAPPSAPPAPDLTAPVLAALDAMGEQLGRSIEGLRVAFDREVRAEATREKVVDRLHAELQEYKQDFLFNALRPIVMDLIQLHDDIGKIVSAYHDGGNDPAEASPKLLDLMRGFQQGIEDILYRQGIETFRVEGDAFDPSRQRSYQTVPSEDPALVKTIAARLRTGFLYRDRVIRPEIVSVYTPPRGS